jgi:uncharacterized DUF497 family protein
MTKRLSRISRSTESASERLPRFYDPNGIEDYDAGHSVAESRFVIIGLSSRRLMYVVYAERAADLVRIISARKADRAEQEIYERTRTINL